MAMTTTLYPSPCVVMVVAVCRNPLHRRLSDAALITSREILYHVEAGAQSMDRRVSMAIRPCLYHGASADMCTVDTIPL